MKKIGYYLLQTGESPVEKFFKQRNYASTFVHWLSLQFFGACLIYSNEIFDFIEITFFHAAGPANTDKGRDLAFFWAAIIFMIVGTWASIGTALQIKREREKRKEKDGLD